MSAARAVLGVALADFRERVRRPSFLVTIAFCLYAAWGFLPPAGARWVTFTLDGHRPLYSSAWVGTLGAILCATFLGFIGFYVVRGGVQFDRRTGVGQLLAASVLRGASYTLGKALASFLVLAAMIGIVALASGGVQLLRGEDRHLAPLELLAPYVFLALPVMAIVAAFAVLFDSVRWLRGGLGNIAYWFLWTAVLATSFSGKGGGPDLVGLGGLVPGVVAACHAAYPAYDMSLRSLNFGIMVLPAGAPPVTTFAWGGGEWTAAYVASRAGWLLVAAGLALAAALFFDRFDVSRALPRRGARPEQAPAARLVSSPPAPGALTLTPLRGEPAAAVPRFVSLVAAELRLLLKGRSRWWFAGALALMLAGLVTPLAAARGVVLPIAWFWPVLAWSALGTREARHGTAPILFSAPHPLRRQIPAAWAAGALLAALLGGAVALRLVLAGDARGLFAWAVGAAFIPALALALGAWTGVEKAFEAVYTALWYMGPLQATKPLDFMGASPAAARSLVPAAWLAAAVALLALAFLGRARSLRN